METSVLNIIEEHLIMNESGVEDTVLFKMSQKGSHFIDVVLGKFKGHMAEKGFIIAVLCYSF